MVVGELAQMIERPLSMREAPGSVSGFSKSSAVVSFSLYAVGKDPIGAVAQLVRAPVL